MKIDFVEMMFDNNMRGIQRVMDLTWKRNEALTSNIANAETPGYRALDVTFAGELQKAFDKPAGPLTATNSRHMDLTDASMAHLIPDLSGMTRSDGNNVDLDIQMGKLAQNSGKYTIAADLVRKKLQILRNAVRFSGGR